MSMMSTRPVLYCRRCGKALVVTQLSTQVEDPDGTLLHEFMVNLHKIAYCDFHRKQRVYYSEVGRLEEWERGAH